MSAIFRWKDLLTMVPALFLAACSSIGGNIPESSKLARIQPGMSQEQVLLVLGPPDPTLTILFPQRNELSWGWTLQEIGEPENFFVLFDAREKTVRSTMLAPFRVLTDFY